jgi:hypothetical protein
MVLMHSFTRNTTMQRAKVILIIAVTVLVALTLSGAQQPVRAGVPTLTVSCPGDALVTITFSSSVTGEEYRLSGSGPGLPSASYTASGAVPETFVWVLSGPGSWSIILDWRHMPGTPFWTVSGATSSLVATCLPVMQPGEPPVAGPLYANLLDGRINSDQSRDGAAPVAVYCADNVIDIYTVDPATSAGQLVLSHAIVPGAPDSANELLAASAGVSLYRLSSGAYQLSAAYADGKPYIITWEGCDGANLTHLAS